MLWQDLRLIGGQDEAEAFYSGTVHLCQGKSVKAVSRELGIPEQTCYRRRKEYGGMKISQARRLKELDQEQEEPRTRPFWSEVVDKISYY